MAKYDSQKLLAHLNSKWAGRPCAQCGVANWQVQDSVFELREFNAGSLVVGGPVLPLIPVICANCGNTILVNALVAQVIERPPVSVEAPKEPKP
jgi:hypothetical protein